MLALIGIGVIFLAWMAQLAVLIRDRNSRRICSGFPLTYMAGVAILVYDGFSGGMPGWATANLMIIIAAGLMFLMIRNRR